MTSASHQFDRKTVKPPWVVVAKPFQHEILAFDIAELAQSLSRRRSGRDRGSSAELYTHGLLGEAAGGAAPGAATEASCRQFIDSGVE
jgi:hypothetical protein